MQALTSLSGLDATDGIRVATEAALVLERALDYARKCGGLRSYLWQQTPIPIPCELSEPAKMPPHACMPYSPSDDARR